MNCMVFSKHLAGPPIEEPARQLVEKGISSLDLVVRKGGHVEPERVAEQLPEVVSRLKTVGSGVGMITTNITEADATAEQILRTAVSLGVKYYKLGYFLYAGFGNLRRQRDEARARIRDLGQLNSSLGIHGGYHNHSGAFLGASLWDMAYMLEDTDPAAVGCYLDPMHATTEHACDAWRMGIDLLIDRISMLAVKDFDWIRKPVGIKGGRTSGLRLVPVGEGNVQWPEVVGILKNKGFRGPVSIHCEYQGFASFQDMTLEEVLEQAGRDHAAFQKWWSEA